MLLVTLEIHTHLFFIVPSLITWIATSGTSALTVPRRHPFLFFYSICLFFFLCFSLFLFFSIPEILIVLHPHARPFPTFLNALYTYRRNDRSVQVSEMMKMS